MCTVVVACDRHVWLGYRGREHLIALFKQAAAHSLLSCVTRARTRLVCIFHAPTLTTLFDVGFLAGLDSRDPSAEDTRIGTQI